MTPLSPEDERAVDRLSFYLLKEAYSAVAGLLRKVDPSTAELMFDGVGKQLEQVVRRIHEQQSEGPASTAIAMAVAGNIIEVLDVAHRPREASASRGSDPVADQSNTDRPTQTEAVVSKLRQDRAA